MEKIVNFIQDTLFEHGVDCIVSYQTLIEGIFYVFSCTNLEDNNHFIIKLKKQTIDDLDLDSMQLCPVMMREIKEIIINQIKQ